MSSLSQFDKNTVTAATYGRDFVTSIDVDAIVDATDTADITHVTDITDTDETHDSTDATDATDATGAIDAATSDDFSFSSCEVHGMERIDTCFQSHATQQIGSDDSATRLCFACTLCCGI